MEHAENGEICSLAEWEERQRICGIYVADCMHQFDFRRTVVYNFNHYLSFKLLVVESAFWRKSRSKCPATVLCKKRWVESKDTIEPKLSTSVDSILLSFSIFFFLVDTSESESCDEKSPASSHCNGFLGAVFKNIEH